MNFRKNQAGFSAVELLIVVVIVGLLGFVGYMVYGKQQDKNNAVDTSQNSSRQESANDVPEAPEIKSTSDLDKASATLDNVDTNNDSSELDKEVSNF